MADRNSNTCVQLHEQYRPKSWGEVVGQDKALAKIEQLRRRGLGGRAYWITGQSGTGKTTIARLIATDIADDWCIEEVDAEQLTPGRVTELERLSATRGMGRGGRAFIVNEAHGLKKATIRQLLVSLEGDRVPSHVAWLFTTTVDGQDNLFADCDDSHPLLSRCAIIGLARRDLCEPFAARCREIAQAEGLDGQPHERYVKLMKKCGNNLRAALQAVEAGEMIAD